MVPRSVALAVIWQEPPEICHDYATMEIKQLAIPGSVRFVQENVWSELLRDELGWQPIIAFDAGIEKAQ